MTRTTFTTTAQGLDRKSLPLRLFEKSKTLGVWNPSDLDFTLDHTNWQTLDPLEKRVLLHLTTLFQSGEEAVTLDLLPLIMTIAQEGRLEEEMYLTSFLWEEAKHVDFFQRFLTEVVVDVPDLTAFETPIYQMLFKDKLPTALNALLTDTSPIAQARASVTYNMIVEGVLAETGYHAYYAMLERCQAFPALQKGIYLLKQDESRHITYGIYLLSRLIHNNDNVWDAVEETLNELLPMALMIIDEIFQQYDVMPFGLKLEDFSSYAITQYQARYAKLMQARTTSPAELFPQ